MVIGNLKNTEQACKTHKGMAQLFEFIKNTNFNDLPLGRVEVDGDNIFINNVDVDGVDQAVQPLEMHRKYIDVHVLLAGEEKIGWKPIEEIEHYTKEYAEEGDCALSDDAPHFYATLKPGDFAVVFPEDPHAPAIGKGKIRKLICKVKCEY